MTQNPAKTQSFAVKFALLALAAMFAASLSSALPAHASKRKSAHASATVSTRHRYRHYYGVPTYMADPAIGDDSRFDDPVVRQAALDAIGRQNGSVVAVDPSTGRILTIVNQKLAYSAGFEPCSTTKPII